MILFFIEVNTFNILKIKDIKVIFAVTLVSLIYLVDANISALGALTLSI